MAGYSAPYSGFSSYFDPQNTYGGIYQPGQWAKSPLGGGFGGYLENPGNWDATFERHLASLGLPSLGAEAEFGRRNLGRYTTGYGAALATNPVLKFQDYLKDFTDLNRDFMSATPGQRGETPALYAGRMRTIPRG